MYGELNEGFVTDDSRSKIGFSVFELLMVWQDQ